MLPEIPEFAVFGKTTQPSMDSITKCKKNHLNYTLGSAKHISDQTNKGPSEIGMTESKHKLRVDQEELETVSVNWWGCKGYFNIRGHRLRVGLAKLATMSKDDWRWWFNICREKGSDVVEGLFSVQECVYRCLPVLRVLCGTERMF
ncbi:hypothetical protein Tco_0803263 [Tanacetum coccineum]|uniref:Uncharacterized protein n=1 Tax=Tanacetum coccineum TaxID=301880 RepID=A0ABQ5A585_9ASTR